jgi:tryptophan synthase alpha chain
MSRIDGRFAELRSNGRTALIPYVTAGDPRPETTVPLMHALVEAGADLLELGVPFSDPMADGPVIQAACERALRQRMGLRQVLELVARFREQDRSTPVVLMGYLNPIEVLGVEQFAVEAQQAGVDGVLTVDLPPEESGDLVAALRSVELDPVFLIAPTTTDQRIAAITRLASGFLYYVSLKGITGAANLDVAAVTSRLASIRTHTSLPLGVGFGIKDPQSAAAVAPVADAVVVGSALVRLIEQNEGQTDKILTSTSALLAAMRAAIDGAAG